MSNIGQFATISAFNNSSIAGWQVVSGSVDYIGTYWVASAGQRSLDMNGLTQGTIGQQLTGLVAGQKYTITFDMAGNPDGAPTDKTLSAIAANAGSNSYTFNTTSLTHSIMGWKQFSFVFTADGTSDWLSFSSTTPGAFGPALDNVTISEGDHAPSQTPLPPALVLFGSALVGLTMLGRRRRQAPKMG